MLIRAFAPADTEAVVGLWETCGLTRPWNDPRLDIQRKLAYQPDLFRVGELDGVVVASVMAGYDGHRGWVYYLAVSPSLRGRGFGRRLLDDVAERLRALGCPKVNLMVRPENDGVVAFYDRLGYVGDDVIFLGLRLIEDAPQN